MITSHFLFYCVATKKVCAIESIGETSIKNILPYWKKVVPLQTEKYHQSMINTNTIPTTNIADIYMSVLASLSVEDRLDLIAKLSSSIKNNSQAAFTPVGDLRTIFCGEWGDVGELRDSAYTGREVLNW